MCTLLGMFCLQGREICLLTLISNISVYSRQITLKFLNSAGPLSLSPFLHTIFFFNFLGLFIYLFIYLFLAALGLRFCERAFSSCGERGATLHRGARASHYRGLSCCGAQAPDAQAQ